MTVLTYTTAGTYNPTGLSASIEAQAWGGGGGSGTGGGNGGGEFAQEVTLAVTGGTVTAIVGAGGLAPALTQPLTVVTPQSRGPPSRSLHTAGRAAAPFLAGPGNGLDQHDAPQRRYWWQLPVLVAAVEEAAARRQPVTRARMGTGRLAALAGRR